MSTLKNLKKNLNNGSKIRQVDYNVEVEKLETTGFYRTLNANDCSSQNRGSKNSRIIKNGQLNNSKSNSRNIKLNSSEMMNRNRPMTAPK